MQMQVLGSCDVRWILHKHTREAVAAHRQSSTQAVWGQLADSFKATNETWTSWFAGLQASTCTCMYTTYRTCMYTIYRTHLPMCHPNWYISHAMYRPNHLAGDETVATGDDT